MLDTGVAASELVAGRRPRVRTRRGKKAVVVYLERDTARRLKVLAAQRDTTIQALGVEAIDLLMTRYTR